MKHDPRLARLDVHPGWCRCRMCGPRKGSAAAEIRELIALTRLGVIYGAIVAGAVLVIHHWPAIAVAVTNG